MRPAWMIAGWSAFALGAIGAVLPLLPTVPFMLLAAFCFDRGSERFHNWLVGHARFGPAIRDWRREGAISPAGKRAAVLAIALSFAISVALGFPLWILAVQAVALGGVAVFVLSRPSPGIAADD